MNNPHDAPRALSPGPAFERLNGEGGLGVPLCIDARMLGRSETGVARYAETLVSSLEMAGVRPLLLDEDRSKPQRGRVARWLHATLPMSRRTRPSSSGLVARDVFREAQIFFNLHGRLMPVTCDEPPGIMHWTYPVPLRMVGWRNLYTVHDAIPLIRPDLTPISAPRHRRLLRQVVKEADRIVTVSQAAADEIVRATACSPSLVVNLLQAVDVAHEPRLLPAGLLQHGYFLFCGSIEPRKNLVRLAQANALSGAHLPLVLVGPDGWRADEVHAAIKGTAAEARVVRLPYQPRDALLNLLASARALLFPTLAEGFGLPVAEAMSLGTPVMTSSSGALAEIAGGAASLVDPLDIRGMAGAIAALGSDDALCSRLAQAGKARAIAFQRKPYAERLVSLYAATAYGH